jgi:hypothetical protein
LGENIAIRCDGSKKEKADMKHYQSRDEHFKLDLPRHWNAFPPVRTNRAELIRFASEESGSDLLIISRTPHNPRQSLQDVSEKVQQNLAKKRCENFVSSEVQIGSKFVPTLDFERTQGDRTWSCRYYFFAGDTLRYVLGFGTINKTGMFRVFDRVAGSFEILGP